MGRRLYKGQGPFFGRAPPQTIAQVLAQLRSGKAVIVFDQETDSATILSRVKI
ncbi:YheU family protein [uncultured Desulfobacter sp.]|uniref:YheU family protein n=1 Tax=uncultured Desulfobacter sp. TaxID=240139 RepID=UPI0029F56D9D|nr:YheU family protein [uncultured Desulfobacter sp.]